MCTVRRGDSPRVRAPRSSGQGVWQGARQPCQRKLLDLSNQWHKGVLELYAAEAIHGERGPAQRLVTALRQGLLEPTHAGFRRPEWLEPWYEAQLIEESKPIAEALLEDLALREEEVEELALREEQVEEEAL